MARRRAAQLTINHERWLVSYADFITLLFAFFVVMYSVSQVSETKYRVLSDTLVSTFKFQSQTLNPIQVGQPSLSSDPSVIDTAQPKTGEEIGDGAFSQETELPHMAENMRQSLADLIERDLVDIHSNEFWLEITLNSTVLFPSASATPTADAQLIFAEVARHLKGAANPIQVEGYTDDQPIRTDRFPSNWELSAARASAVVKLLQAESIDPGRLSAVGYGEFQPIADNTTAQGRTQNRRVVLMVAKERIERPSQGASKAVQTLADAESFGPVVEATGRTPREEGRNSTAVDNLNTGGLDGEPIQTPSGLRAIKLESGGLLFTSDPSRQPDDSDANGSD